MEKRIGLGKGLSALMGEDLPAATPVVNAIMEKMGNEIMMAPLELLTPSPFQPRRVFEEGALTDLVQSIKEKGVLQPLLVRGTKVPGAVYEIIAGERRYRASKLAGLDEVPVIVKDFDDQATLEVALIENLQREDLNPLEEADAYKRLLQEFDYTQEELAKVVGKSRSYVANMMRLLELPTTIKNLVESKQLTAGHARALINTNNPEELAEEIILNGLSVRQAEKLAANHGAMSRKNEKKIGENIKKIKAKDEEMAVLEEELLNILKTNVSASWNGKKGKLSIEFTSLDMLDALITRLTDDGPLLK